MIIDDHDHSGVHDDHDGSDAHDDGDHEQPAGKVHRSSTVFSSYPAWMYPVRSSWP